MDIGAIPDDILLRARQVRLLALDVDGVLTDGSLYFDNQGNEALKAFNSKDGQGIKLLQHNGINVGIITARHSPMVAKRAQELGINHLMQGRENKLEALPQLLADSAVDYRHIAYMGDDLADLAVIRRVGLAMTPADGHWFIRKQSHWISGYRGGSGAVREACDLILLAQGKFAAALDRYH